MARRRKVRADYKSDAVSSSGILIFVAIPEVYYTPVTPSDYAHRMAPRRGTKPLSHLIFMPNVCIIASLK